MDSEIQRLAGDILKHPRFLQLLQLQHHGAENSVYDQMCIRDSSYYENGEHNMTLSILVGLADFYNTSTDYLLERTNDPAPPRKR